MRRLHQRFLFELQALSASWFEKAPVWAPLRCILVNIIYIIRPSFAIVGANCSPYRVFRPRRLGSLGAGVARQFSPRQSRGNPHCQDRYSNYRRPYGDPSRIDCIHYIPCKVSRVQSYSTYGFRVTRGISPFRRSKAGMSSLPVRTNQRRSARGTNSR